MNLDFLFGIQRETNPTRKIIGDDPYYYFPRIADGSETKIYKTFLGIKIQLIHHYCMMDSTNEIREFIPPWDDTDRTMQICLRGKLIGYQKEFWDIIKYNRNEPCN